MDISEITKDLLNKTSGFIKINDFYGAYKYLTENVEDKGEICLYTKALLKADVNPLKYMNIVPPYFLYGITDKKLEVHVPANVKLFGANCFSRCNLKEVKIDGTIRDWVSLDEHYDESPFYFSECVVKCDEDTKVFIKNNSSHLGGVEWK